MRQLHITQREVLNNLIRFKDRLLEMLPQERTKKHEIEHMYRTLLNCCTGELRFAQKISSLGHHLSKKRQETSIDDWKEVYLIVMLASPQTVRFEVRDSVHRVIRPSDVALLAWQVLHETLNVLNIKGQEIHSTSFEMLPEEVVLQDLSSIHIAVQEERIEHLPEWAGSISRVEAEERLQGKPIGTFLIRAAEEMAVAIATALSLSNCVSVSPYLLTFVQGRKTIGERLLLRTAYGWILYADEPMLSLYSDYAPSPQMLLSAYIHSMKA